jgi:hypothetical protein
MFYKQPRPLPTATTLYTPQGQLTAQALRAGHVERHAIPDTINPGRFLLLRADVQGRFHVQVDRRSIYVTNSLHDARKHMQTTLRRFALLGHP